MKDTKAGPVEKPPTGEGTNDATRSKETADVRQVAVKVVEDVLNRAAEQTDPNRNRTGAGTTKDLNGGPLSGHKPDNDDDAASSAPTIQIDLVGSRTPSPEEEESVIQFPTYASSRTDRRNKADAAAAAAAATATASSNHQNGDEPPKDSLEDSASLREFLVGYVQDLIKKAVPLAEERLNSTSKLEVLEMDASPGGACPALKNRRAPWHTRFRAALTNFMQAVCVCGERREDTLS